MAVNNNQGTNNQTGSQSTGQQGQDKTQGFENYPKWNKTWHDKLGEVDNQIVDFYGQENPNSDELPGRIGSWFEGQQFDTDTRGEFDKAKSEPNFLRQQVQGRVDQLSQQGRLRNYKPDATQGQQRGQGQQSAQGQSGSGTSR